MGSRAPLFPERCSRYVIGWTSAARLLVASMILLSLLLSCGKQPASEVTGTAVPTAVLATSVPTSASEPSSTPWEEPATTVAVASPVVPSTPVASASPEATPTPVTPTPTATVGKPLVPSLAELEAMIAEMSVRDKVAQMLMIGFHGRSIAESPELATMVGEYHVGGLVMLEANAHDPAQVQGLTGELQALATSSGAGIPLFISINHEGGIVIRITEGITEFPGNMAVGATGQPQNAYLAAALGAEELRAMGINMNLAPVLDINDNPLNPIIGTRSFGASDQMVAEYGRLAVQGMQEQGVIAIAKHFPGHGGVAVDSHGALPVIEASADALWQHELVPFRAAVEQGVAGIMTAHISIPALDATGRPATLSPEILTGLLREQMGYDGLIMTDSLGMAGVSQNRGQVQAAVEAVQAGADILLSTSPMDAHIAIVQTLTGSVQRGEIPLERIDRSVMRILKAKAAYGLFQSPAPVDLSSVGSPENQVTAEEIALQAVTVVRDDGSLIPLPQGTANLLVISPSELPRATEGQGTRFAQLLRERGYLVDELLFNPNTDSRAEVAASAVAQSPGYDVVLFGEWELIKRFVNWGDVWQEELIGALQQSSRTLIVVAWHNPAAILRCPEVTEFVAAYDNSAAQVAAVAAVLSGEHKPTGELPLPLP